MRSGSAAVHRLTALLAVAWVAKYYTTNFSSEEWGSFLRKQLDEAGSPLASGLTFYECGVDHETVTMVPWKHAPKTTSRFPSKFIHTPMTLVSSLPMNGHAIEPSCVCLCILHWSLVRT